MADEEVAGQQVAKACAAGAQAEVDLDAVVAAQRTGVESPDRIEAGTGKVEAGPVHRRQLRAGARIRAREQRVERGDGLPVGQRVDGARHRVGCRADGIGERADGAHAPGRVRREAVEPVVGDLRVGMQHHHVALPMQPEGAVHGGGEALTGGLVDDAYPACRAQFLQVPQQFRLRRRVVDHDDLVRRGAIGGKHPLQTMREGRGAAADGDDDVDRRHRRSLPSTWRAAANGKRSQPTTDSRYARRARVR